MTGLPELIQQSSGNVWLFIPTAILLGALHGMEPGHSKMMMAAFIIAVRGTVAQAVLLGLSAAISHSFIIWLLAALALRLGSHWNAESTEPYFQLFSGLTIIALAAWMFWRTRRDALAEAAHDHDHGEHGPNGGEWVALPDGHAEVSVFEENVPPRFRIHFYDAAKQLIGAPTPDAVRLQTIRSEGSLETFEFRASERFLESTTELPEPHEFEAVLSIGHGVFSGKYEFSMKEGHHHHHGADGVDISSDEYQDAHERAHAEDIARRFKNRNVTTGQIVLFGLTGGLMPCPAALTVLLVCLQLKKFTLGFTLVLSFSFGLALTMVAAGAAAAWSVQHASRKIRGFGAFARKAPYLSSAVLVVLGIYVTIQGWTHLPH